MNTIMLAILAVGMISLGIFGLIGLWAYSRITPKPRPAKPRNSDLIVVHTFKKRRRKLLHPAPVGPALDTAPGDDSQWRRPGAASPAMSTERPPLPFYEPDKPRHVFIPHTPGVIIPHVTVGPEPRPQQPRLSQRTQRSQRTALIKTARVESDSERTGFVRVITR